MRQACLSKSPYNNEIRLGVLEVPHSRKSFLEYTKRDPKKAREEQKISFIIMPIMDLNNLLICCADILVTDKY